MRFLSASFAFASLCAAASACSVTAAPTAPAVTPGGDGGDVASSTVLDASCAVTVSSYPLLAATHVPTGTSKSIVWNSDPPSSGSHYPVWAAFGTYDSPIDPGYWVHDLEHGAIVFLYNCAVGAGDCASLPTSFQQVVASLADDPLCKGSSSRVRYVIVPDPDLKTRVAAVAWGWTYASDCLDPTTLTSFAKDHYGQGPEQLCNDGQSTGLAPQ